MGWFRRKKTENAAVQMDNVVAQWFAERPRIEVVKPQETVVHPLFADILHEALRLVLECERFSPARVPSHGNDPEQRLVALRDAAQQQTEYLTIAAAGATALWGAWPADPAARPLAVATPPFVESMVHYHDSALLQAVGLLVLNDRQRINALRAETEEHQRAAQRRLERLQVAFGRVYQNHPDSFDQLDISDDVLYELDLYDIADERNSRG